MSKKFSIGKFLPEILLENIGTRLTAREIALRIVEKYPEAVEQKRLKSRAVVAPLDTQDAMVQQIVAEIGARRKFLQRNDSRIKTTEGRPRKYFLSNLSEEEEVETAPDLQGTPAQTDIQGFDLNEASLYPLLKSFAQSELSVYAMRIDERRSSNSRGKGGNQWLFPDLVGMQDLSSTWHREIVDCAKEYSDKKSKLWSFEVKLRLNSSNVRESYFQAVSNSSWSNLGYLVAAEIQGEKTLDELRMLSGLHGIRVIRLDSENLSESQILLPARERADVDWGSMNRLALENGDFLNFIGNVRRFYQTGDTRSADWVA
ncbi:COG2958 family protein [Antarctobacter heliothermus]|uniref:HrgA protein n=1 Tax=Antarctobacter heliothermus TaxID=74033 RepID=A0A239C698_9RHOB|nr:HrgA protein [Antarctobacter heliothermus]SNS14913.1 hypothetical protein SAMN04488078_1005108 [Antarctobacter heliothermus]